MANCENVNFVFIFYGVCHAHQVNFYLDNDFVIFTQGVSNTVQIHAGSAFELFSLSGVGWFFSHYGPAVVRFLRLAAWSAGREH